MNCFRKGPVCDDGSTTIGRVACRNLGATLISITKGNGGPSSRMFIHMTTIITSSLCIITLKSLACVYKLFRNKYKDLELNPYTNK